MLTYYHGTRRSDAVAMAGLPGGAGTIDVLLGGGEFGRGFYGQDSKANALTWAQNRFGHAQNPSILQLELDDQAFRGLTVRQLTAKQAWKLSQKIYAKGTQKTHREGVDVVVGLLNGSAWVEQQKFESPKAQTLLNGTQTTRTVI